MPKYLPHETPLGELKPINQMTVSEYLSWKGRCGGRSRSKRKLKALRRAARSKKPGLKMFHALVKKVAAEVRMDEPTMVTVVFSTQEYPINTALALKILEAARKHRQRNALK